MGKAVDFLKECGVFFMLTESEGKPQGRPFGAVMEKSGDLYFTTGRKGNVYKQISENANIQIVALKNGTRDWIRITGKAEECADLSLKQEIMHECPVLVKRYGTPDAENFVLFKVADRKSMLNIDGKFENVD